jgi:hypothetical protein
MDPDFTRSDTIIKPTMHDDRILGKERDENGRIQRVYWRGICAKMV